MFDASKIDFDGAAEYWKGASDEDKFNLLITAISELVVAKQRHEQAIREIATAVSSLNNSVGNLMVSQLANTPKKGDA
jgi:hypothetical protein